MVDYDLILPRSLWYDQTGQSFISEKSKVIKKSLQCLLKFAPLHMMVFYTYFILPNFSKMCKGGSVKHRENYFVTFKLSVKQ